MHIPEPPTCPMPPPEGAALAFQLRAVLADVQRWGTCRDYRLTGIQTHLAEVIRFAEMIATAPGCKGVRLTKT